jgi:hypothetical protein
LERVPYGSDEWIADVRREQDVLTLGFQTPDELLKAMPTPSASAQSTGSASGPRTSLRLKRPAPPRRARSHLHLNPRPRLALLFLRSLSVGRFAHKIRIWQTVFFSSKPISKYCGSYSKSLAEFLCFREAGALWFIRLVRRRASAHPGWHRFRLLPRRNYAYLE